MNENLASIPEKTWRQITSLVRMCQARASRGLCKTLQSFAFAKLLLFLALSVDSFLF
jgi:hypothetical protein